MKLLDLFCGAGGCSMGYHRAGFLDITGIDSKPQPNYPFDFHQADVFEWCKNNDLSQFDLIHASPPCQEFSALKSFNTFVANCIPQTREILKRSEKNYVIENVRGSGLKNGVMLCGTMFGLEVYRHRYFETKPEILFPPNACNHSRPAMDVMHSPQRKRIKEKHGNRDAEYYWKMEMGLHWMKKRDEWRESIPVSYTEWIGRQILQQIKPCN